MTKTANPGILPVMRETDDIIRIAGIFTGFAPDAVFKLDDGRYWLQSGPEFWPHHAPAPMALIEDDDQGSVLFLPELDRRTAVIPVTEVIESRIKGRFAGWHGQSVYMLSNGQTWRQAKFLKKYAAKYMPEVLIYATAHGHLMQVAGTRVKVQRIG